MKKNVASQIVGAQMITAADGTIFTGAVTVSVTGDGGTQATGSVGSGACTHEGGGFHTYAPAQAETNYDHVAFTFAGTGAISATVQIYPTFPQTGDSFARIGAPAGASIAADLAVIDNFVDDLEGRLTSTRAGYLDNLSVGAVALEATAQSILTDTAEIGAAGAGLTNINLPNQTMDIVGNITGNLSGSVGSVTGNVGGNVAGSVASVASGGITATSIAADAITSSELAASACEKIADALLDRDMSTGTDSGSTTVRTVRQALRFLRNKWSIAAGTLTVLKEDDSTTSWTAAVTGTAGADPVTAVDPGGP